MDSANSGSIQSSSTAGTGDNDQEYDSLPRGAGGGHDSMSSFFNQPAANSFGGAVFDNALSSSLHLYPSLNKLNNNNQLAGSNSSMMFHDHQDQVQQIGQCYGALEIIGPNNNNNNNFLHSNNNNGLDMVGPPSKFGPFRSLSEDVNNNNTRNLHPASLNNLGRHNNNAHNYNTQPQPQPQPQPQQQQAGPGGGAQQGGGSGSGRNPKKRSRASRRAPTTVMTTDTTNFRQMVQEFTGIPAAPFSSSGFPSRTTRLDLFGFPGMGGPGPITRPVPQKLSNPLMIPSGLGSSPHGMSAANVQNFLTFQPPSTTLQPSPPVDRAAGSGGGVAEQPGWTAAVMMNVGGTENSNHGGGGGGALRAEGMLDSWINCSSDN